MLIQCPRCQTTFRVSDEAVKGNAATFRCSRCKNIFELESVAEDEPRGDETFPDETRLTEGQEQQPELNFTFPHKEEDLDPPHDKELHGPGQADETIMDDPAEHWSISAGARKHEEPFTISPSTHVLEDGKIVDAPAEVPERERDVQPFPEARDATGNVFPIDTFRDQPASTTPYLGLLVLLVVFFAFTAAYQQVHPSASDELMGKIPLIGSSVLHNAHLKNGVLLKSLRGGFQTIQGNREVFVVNGEALNHNPVVIRRVQIAGQLYDQDGKAIEQQVIWVGNAISAKIVRGMSAQDVIDLQRLQPLKSFDIPPGDSVPFTIVFFKPSKAVKDFSCEVQSAEGAA
jgi:predicted Zn finger-like uncharacterized protein